MADATSELHKKFAGLSVGQWALVGGGGLLLFILWRRHSSSGSAAPAVGGAATSLQGGNTVPPAITVVGTSAGPTTGQTVGISTLSQWEQAFISTSGLTPAKAYDAFTAWQNGTGVTATGYRALSKALGTLGLPPGAIGYPLRIAKTPGTTTTPTSQHGTPPQLPPNPPNTPAPSSGNSTGGGSSAAGFWTTPVLGKNLTTATLAGATWIPIGSYLATGRYTGWQVSGGLPVYFTWHGNGSPTQGGAPAGSSTVDLYVKATTPLSHLGNHTKAGGTIQSTKGWH